MNPRSRAHEAREDSRSSTAQVWPAGVEPAISGSRHRRGGLSPTARCNRTPGGTRTRASGLRTRRHCRSTTGACTGRRPWSRTRPCSVSASRAAADTCLQGSGDRIRTCPSRLTVARLADSTTPERNKAEAAGFEPAGSQAACALATRCLTTRPCLQWSRRDSNPRPPRVHVAGFTGITQLPGTRRGGTHLLVLRPHRELRGGRRGSRTLKAARPTRFRDGVPRQWQSFRKVAPAGFEPASRRLRVGRSSC